MKQGELNVLLSITLPG